ncbi:MAG: ferrous iron transport protein A [Defluviitaleaceae bacterium]|nr:ferrous iron transport protein A [Defluviitaleaceae bacterium]
MLNLYKAKKGRGLCVVSVPDIDLLQNLGLREGTNISVKNRYALGGPVLLRVEKSFSVAIGKDIATQISVKETNK